MIFGKTVEQVAEAKSIEAKKLIFGVKKFALTPKMLTDGRKVWLSSYYEYRYGNVNTEGEYSFHHDTDARRYLEHSLNHVELYSGYRKSEISRLEALLSYIEG